MNINAIKLQMEGDKLRKEGLISYAIEKWEAAAKLLEQDNPMAAAALRERITYFKLNPAEGQ